MNYRMLIRMAKWSHRPPGWKKVRLVLGIIAVCLLLAGFEFVFGWPEWLTVNSDSRGRLPGF